LEPKAGYIPVYIRLGDTPLSEINPMLAEAFREKKESRVSSVSG
jgi:endonuclease YncB( thermonuclease family)